MSWNPDFPRTKKRNCVSHGKSSGPRRYFFVPCVMLVFTVFMWRSGFIAVFLEDSYRLIERHLQEEPVVRSAAYEDFIQAQHSQIEFLQAENDALRASLPRARSHCP